MYHIIDTLDFVYLAFPDSMNESSQYLFKLIMGLLYQIGYLFFQFQFVTRIISIVRINNLAFLI